MTHSHTVIKKTLNKGLGLFASKLIKKGEIVWNDSDLIHQKYSKEELKNLPKKISRLAYWDGTHYTIDTDDPGNYMNHSCNPNCWWENGSLVAKRNIPNGSEVTYDYATTDIYGINGKKYLVCRCGSENCRKIIRPDDLIKNDKLRNAYKNHIPEYTMKYINLNYVS